MCTALAATVNTVTVADSAGAQRTVMAAVTEPEVLLDLAGMELESNDSTRLHEVEAVSYTHLDVYKRQAMVKTG